MTAAVLEVVANLKHDLGKYVAWRCANLDESAWTGPITADVIECLRADLLQTYQGRPAWQVWEEHTRALPRPLAEPELVSVRRAVERLHRFESALVSRDEPVLAQARAELRSAQSEIRTALSDLWRRLRTGA
jgi:hypothetical protein